MFVVGLSGRGPGEGERDGDGDGAGRVVPHLLD